MVLAAFAEALQRQLPETRVILRAIPGGNVELSAAMVAETEPAGLLMGPVDMESIIAKLGGAEIYDISQFHIVGALGRDIDLFVGSIEAGVTSIDSLRARSEPAIMPVRATSSGAYFQGLLTNALLGTRILPVTGYDSGARELAFRSGEAQVVNAGVSPASRYIEDGVGTILFQFSRGAIPEALGRPVYLDELDYDPAYAWIIDFFEASALENTLAVSLDTPPALLEELRTAVAAAAADPAYISAAADLLTLDFVPGAEVEERIQSVLAGSGSFAASINRAMDCGRHIAETGEACGP